MARPMLCGWRQCPPLQARPPSTEENRHFPLDLAMPAVGPARGRGRQPGEEIRGQLQEQQHPPHPLLAPNLHM